MTDELTPLTNWAQANRETVYPAIEPMDERHVVAYLNLNPNTPLNWPLETIRRLLVLRARKGHEAFLRQIIKMMVA